MKNLTQADWSTSIKEDNTVILDVRTPNEWAEGIIENAILINILEPQSFMGEIENLDKSKNYYVYCRSGARSGQACQVMNSIGINETNNLSGGILEWTGKTVLPN
ncbi:MAG: rhodanese-like domain-containing protein [Flavobacteriaceae bacterium]|nr:rhodanese-like domain-containing protein [Flavobacteriaceae bacterium]